MGKTHLRTRPGLFLPLPWESNGAVSSDSKPPAPEPGRRPRLGVFAAGTLILGALAFLATLGSFAEHRTPALIAMLTAGAAWIAVIPLAARGHARLAIVLPLAVAMRLVTLGGDLGLSDDLWRYGWEGGLVLEGKSPYAQAPNSPSLASERERWREVFERMNNPDVSAAYPPVTQIFAAAVVATQAASLPPGPLERALRLAFSLADLFVLWPLIVLLKKRGLSSGLAVIWAWSPLVVWEFASSAHFDSLGIFLLLWSAAVLIPASDAKLDIRSALGGSLLSLAFMTKYLPLVAAPYLFVRRPRSATAGAIAAFLATVLLGFSAVAMLDGGLAGVFSGLGEYGLRWESWNLTYRFVEPLFNSLGERSEGLSDPRRLGRLAIGAVAAVFALWHLLRQTEPLIAVFSVLAAFLILTPTLHPWYLTWILPFLAFVPGRLATSWLWLAAASPLLYWPLTGWQARAEWVEPAWLWPSVALPFFLLLAFGVFRRPREVEPR